MIVAIVEGTQVLEDSKWSLGKLNLEFLPAGILLYDLLQHSPVGARLILWHTSAALQVEGVHSLADVVPQNRLRASDLPLEG